ncbi:MAG TPA: HlyC/CorC family transporter [Aliiroseovarius sp.]|nr:HlyC/CorC family transporter [Aliiroseovarius sp.]
MGDQSDGSSIAAQSAQTRNISDEPGLFTRLLSAFRANGQGDPAVLAQKAGSQGPGLVAPGIGLGNLRALRVEDVMIPKAEMVAVPADISKDELVGVFRDSGLTRLPVYDGTPDTPLGFVHLKDFALKHGFNGKGGRFSIRQMIRPLIFAPPSMGAGVLLQKMQSGRIHMALVIDEYGGVDGLVTIEDLIEQVIGEIEDEHDPEEDALWIEEKPGCFLVQARTPLEDFEAAIGLRLVPEDSDEEVDTMGGLIFVLAGSVPARGEVIEHESGAEIEIVDADPRRIKRLRVRLPAGWADG